MYIIVFSILCSHFYKYFRVSRSCTPWVQRTCLFIERETKAIYVRLKNKITDLCVNEWNKMIRLLSHLITSFYMKGRQGQVFFYFILILVKLQCIKYILYSTLQRTQILGLLYIIFIKSTCFERIVLSINKYLNK